MRSPAITIAAGVLALAGCGSSTGVRPFAADAGDAQAPCDRITESSTLPGVRFDLTGNRCRYTLAEVAAGITFRYRTVVDGSVGRLEQILSGARCDPADPSGLLVELSIGGSGQGYCLCDCGLGPGGTVNPMPAPGSYPNAIDWNGRNWFGPSDTGMPYGPPFPPGTYSLTVHTAGSRSTPAGPVTFAIDGTMTFDLVP